MRYLIILAVSFFPFVMNAQRALPSRWIIPGNMGSFAGIQGSFGMASGSFTNAFAYNILFDDVVDDTRVSGQADRLTATGNIAGGDYELALVAKLRVKQGPHSVLFKFSDAGHADINISRQAFELGMYGNKHYAGDTVDLSSMDMSVWRYQQAGIGWAFEPRPGLAFYLMGNYVNGEQFVEAALDRMWLYTSPLGDTLSWDMKGNFIQSDTGDVGFARPNGAGFSLDLGMTWTFEGERSSWELDAEMRNAGIVQWKPGTVHFEADSAIEFRGIIIGDLRTVEEQFSDGKLADSLEAGVESSFHKGVVNRLMPGWLQAELMQRKDKGIEAGLGMTVRWKANYKPFGWVSAGYRFNSHIATHAEFGYGGYAALQCALKATFEYKRFSVFARVGNLESFAVPTQFGGGSGMLGGRYNF